MILGEYASCDECGTVHRLRIGLGAEPVQAHRFACSSCMQEMGVRVELGKGILFGPNATKTEPVDGAPTINLHASFVFAKGDLGNSSAFPSLEFGQRIFAAAKAKAGPDLGWKLAKLTRDHRPRPHPTEEWEQLRWAWSLTRAGKPDLAEKRFKRFMKQGAYVPAPDGVADWLFQFSMELARPYFNSIFEGAFEQLRIAKDKPDFRRLVEHYGEHMSAAHGRRYFEICTAYFGAFSELSQVHFLIAAGLEVGDDHAAASSDYKATRMFYGNAFEIFGEHVVLLTMLNNVIHDRPFDQLQNISLAEYRKIDKAGRCRAFADNPAFTVVAAEFDNQVRNASHHGGMVFDRVSGRIEYRAGKGGQGELRGMSYAHYLARCSKLFMQILVLLQLELALADIFKARHPL